MDQSDQAKGANTTTHGSLNGVEKSFNEKFDSDPVALTVTVDNGQRPTKPAELFDDRYLQTHRGFKPRHSQMIAIGGAIGTSLFLGTGQALAVGGPAFLFLSYCVLSVVVYGVVTGIAEVATYLPVHGGTMSYYAYRYVSRSLGFAHGYLYWYSLGILIPYEVTAASLLIDYWHPDVSIAVFITVFLAVIVILNFLPVKWYGESEFWFAGLKIILIVGLFFMSFVLFWGGGPNRDRLGFRYWENPGATNTYLVDGSAGRFVAFLQTTVLASFAFVLAPEQLIVTGGEMQSPRYNLPRAAKRYFWRLLILFIPTVLAIGVVCPSNDPALTNHGSGASRSPFVIAVKNAGIPALDSIINGAILISAWSAGNAFLYSSSRSLYSLAVAGNAPRIFKTCNKQGVPYIAVGVSATFGLLAYMNLSNSSSVVFSWFINLTNTSGYISWIVCGVVYIRFRKAADHFCIEIPYRSPMQPWGIYAAMVASFVLLLINGFTVFFSSEWSVSSFMTAYIGIVAFLVIYLGHRWWFKADPWVRSTEEIDMVTGLQEILDAELPPRVRDTFAKKMMVLIE